MNSTLRLIEMPGGISAIVGPMSSMAMRVSEARVTVVSSAATRLTIGFIPMIAGLLVKAAE